MDILTGFVIGTIMTNIASKQHGGTLSDELQLVRKIKLGPHEIKDGRIAHFITPFLNRIQVKNTKDLR